MIVQRLLNQLIAQDVRDFRVLAAIAKVPRQLFGDEAMAHKAWDNTALLIGHGQTISQPYIVARMTELLIQNDPAHVLEIGTGSGYQTAVLAHLVEHVYTMERIKSLQFQARRRLRQLDLHNVLAAAVTRMASKGPLLGQPSHPLPCLADTLCRSSWRNLRRA